MAPSLLSLIGFCVWTLGVVIFGIGTVRLRAIAMRQAAPNAFPADRVHGSERYQRTMRAHANCVENLPVFAALVLSAALIQLESATFEALAVAVLPARILQTVTHIASGSNRATLVRFVFFAPQLACMIAMAMLLLAAGV